MPTVSGADLAKLREGDHASHYYLYVIKPPIEGTATVNGAHEAGATEIAAVDMTGGTYEKHCLMEVNGRRALYKRRDGDWGTVIFHLSPNDLPALAGGEPIVCYRYVPPAVLLPYIDEDFTVYEDGGEWYGNQNIYLDPISRCGPSVAVARLVGGVATVKYYSDSLVMGRAIYKNSWKFIGGTPGSSSQAGTAENPIVVQYTTPGQHLTVYKTTADGLTWHERQIWTIILDEDNSPAYHESDFEISNLRGDWDSGYWDCRVVVRSEADVTEFPDLAMVVLFADDFYNGEKGSIGGRWKYRENIVAVGYIVAGTMERDAETGLVSFDMMGVAGIAKDLLSWPINLQSEGEEGWHTIPDMTFDRAAYHILTQHSTLSNVADIYLPSISKTLYSIDLPETDLYDMLSDQLYSALRTKMVSSRQGMIYFCPDPQLLEEGDRPATNVIDLIDDDWIGEIEMGEEAFVYEVSQVDFIGFGGDEDLTQYGALAPPFQHKTGDVEKVTGIRVDSQDEANILSGLFEGNFNNEFKDIVVTLRGNYRVFDIVPDEYVTLTMAPETNNRGLDWDHVKCYVREVNIDYDLDGEGFEVTLRLEKDILGEPGAPNPFDPNEPPAPPGPTPPPEPPPPPPGPPVTSGHFALACYGDDEPLKPDGAYETLDGGQSWECLTEE